MSEEEVLAFSGGSLMPAEIEAVHAHLDWCPCCQELVNAAVHQWNHPPAAAAGDRIWMATFGPGQIIAGRYRVERFLGRGGMGEVYAAFDAVLGEWVALKTVLSTTSDSPRAMQRLMSEARLARRISHPNVCRVHDVGIHEEPGRVDERLPFLTMEYIEGKRLKQMLRGGALEVEMAVDIARQILRGLSAAHRAGVLHRDLKSDNVMLSARGEGTSGRELRVAITDFGLSQALDGGARAVGGRDRVGSIAYMAPEQLKGRELGPEADVFGFGVVLFEMLCGVLPPLPDREPMGSRQACGALPSSIRPALPKSLDQVVHRCLQHDPRERFARARDVLEALGPQEPDGIQVELRAPTWERSVR